jgi:hypothetical protein
MYERRNVSYLDSHVNWDLRASEAKVANRTAVSSGIASEGHEPTGDMSNRYDRGAQTVGDLQYDPFPDKSYREPGFGAPPWLRFRWRRRGWKYRYRTRRRRKCRCWLRSRLQVRVGVAPLARVRDDIEMGRTTHLHSHPAIGQIRDGRHRAWCTPGI